MARLTVQSNTHVVVPGERVTVLPCCGRRDSGNLIRLAPGEVGTVEDGPVVNALIAGGQLTVIGATMDEGSLEVGILADDPAPIESAPESDLVLEFELPEPSAPRKSRKSS